MPNAAEARAAAVAAASAPAAAGALGAAAVGRRLRVWWPGEAAWFPGAVRGFDTFSGRHFVVRAALSSRLACG